MSRILETANGTTSLTMDYEIEIDYLFDVEKMDDTTRVAYQQVQSFIAQHGETLTLEIEVSIDGGEASLDGIERITSEKMRKTIEYAAVPTYLMKKIESDAEDYAEENGLESFL